MKPETTEWVQKAEGDMNTAQREFAVQDEPNHDAVCFHAQQCAEKYLKARLIEVGLPVMRTHDLEILVNYHAASNVASWFNEWPDSTGSPQA